MEIKPHKKLFTIQWLTLLTISVLLLIIAVLLHIFVPILTVKGKLNFEQFVNILWLCTCGSIVLMWIICVPIIILWIKNLSFYIEDDRVTIHKGILTKIQQNIPYRAITDFKLYRPLYDRFLGIGSILIQTAGQSQNVAGYEGKLSGLLEWESLHLMLKEKLKLARSDFNTSDISDERVSQTWENSNEILEELRAIRKILERQDK